MTTQLNLKPICLSVKDETLLLQYSPNNTQAFVPKKLKWNEITQGCQWELKDLVNSKPITPLINPSEIIKHTYSTIQIEFGLSSRNPFVQEHLSSRPFTSNTNLNSVYFNSNVLIPFMKKNFNLYFLLKLN